MSGGLSAPVGDLGKSVDAGYVVAGHIWFNPASFTSVGFRGDVSYDNWKTKTGNVNFRSLGFTANALIHPAVSKSTVVPYLIGGGGFYNTKSYLSKPYTSSSSGTSSNFGLQGGGGIEFKLSGFSTFAEAKFVNVFTNGNATNWVPITFGVRF